MPIWHNICGSCAFSMSNNFYKLFFHAQTIALSHCFYHSSPASLSFFFIKCPIIRWQLSKWCFFRRWYRGLLCTHFFQRGLQCWYRNSWWRLWGSNRSWWIQAWKRRPFRGELWCPVTRFCRRAVCATNTTSGLGL